MSNYCLDRYPERRFVSTSMNPLDDVVDWIEGLSSTPVLNDLTLLHPALKSLPLIARRNRIKTISAHIEMGVEYINRARNTRGAHSFLDIYYGMLNLSKAVVLLGSQAAKLRKQRTHGASYEPYKNPKNLMTDTIKIYPYGAISLFYATITGQPLGETTVSMSNVYRYIKDLEIEYKDITGQSVTLSNVEIELRELGNGNWRVEAELVQACEQSSINGWKHPTFGTFRRVGTSSRWRSKLFTAGSTDDAVLAARKLFNPFLLYHSSGDENLDNLPSAVGWIPVTKIPYFPVEEFNLLLAFYHLSSVVRYDPELVKAFQDSREWPLILILKRHGLYKFLLLFYSEVMQMRYSFSVS